ncbi:DeoR/GlpR transcriptional regulator [Vibrio ponticus]|uniref:DeoR/GlpR transcriptional regulator n=1 Tax=Vibrio ponticus TaxID=265668 RepID=A0A3N3DNV5_9VIBR|nr:DeoR/GlpR family DNA-binding transcription regulator [Vibrio ponticus]ROV56162.1 DeoR/GlpR transcriptional regulator [Vibrio ponticus]
MQYSSRSIHIMKMLAEFGTVSVIELAEELEVSVETIRRDLKLLDKKGELIRVHGGAIGKSYQDEGTSFNNRANSNMDDKKHLVDQVIANMYDGAVIGLDASSSSWLVAQSMPDIKCTIVTNSINNITALYDKKNITIIGVGGYFSEKYKAFYGMIARNNISRMSLDLCVISCDGFDEDSGVWDSNEYNYEIKKTFIDVSNRVILIADKSKYKKKSLLKICDFDDVDILVSNYLS